MIIIEQLCNEKSQKFVKMMFNEQLCNFKKKKKTEF